MASFRREAISRQVTAKFIPRQSGTPLPQDHMASQDASSASPNSTPSREGLSQEGSNSQVGNSLVSSQAGRQVGNPLPGDSMASQEASAAPKHNSFQGRPFPGRKQLPGR